MPTRNLPNDPHLDHLRKQAKTLLKQVRAGDPRSRRAGRRVPSRAVAGRRAAGDRPQLRIPQLAADRAAPGAGRPATAAHPIARRSADRSTPRSNAPTSSSGWRHCTTGRTIRPGSGPREQLLDAVPGCCPEQHLHEGGGRRAGRRTRGARRGPWQAREEGGPYRWEPLLYLTYSRLDAPHQVEIARLLLEHGADPNAGYLWQGMPSPFTALTGAFGRGEGDQPPHRDRVELARLLLDAGADPNDSQTMYNCGPGLSPAVRRCAPGAPARVRTRPGRRRSVARADDDRTPDTAAAAGGRAGVRVLGGPAPSGRAGACPRHRSGRARDRASRCSAVIARTSWPPSRGTPRSPNCSALMVRRRWTRSTRSSPRSCGARRRTPAPSWPHGPSRAIRTCRSAPPRSAGPRRWNRCSASAST